jgi:hypothetical protein
MTTFAIINRNTSRVENISEDQRNAEEIVLPDPYFVVPIKDTPSLVWTHDGNEWTQILGSGMGGIGDTWDGDKFIRPKPVA